MAEALAEEPAAARLGGDGAVARKELARAKGTARPCAEHGADRPRGPDGGADGVGLRIGGRALPLAWLAEEGPANIGFEGRQRLLGQVLAWDS